MRDHDGKISRSIRELISSGEELASLREAFDEFARFLLDNLYGRESFWTTISLRRPMRMARRPSF